MIRLTLLLSFGLRAALADVPIVGLNHEHDAAAEQNDDSNDADDFSDLQFSGMPSCCSAAASCSALSSRAVLFATLRAALENVYTNCKLISYPFWMGVCG